MEIWIKYRWITRPHFTIWKKFEFGLYLPRRFEFYMGNICLQTCVTYSDSKNKMATNVLLLKFDYRIFVQKWDCRVHRKFEKDKVQILDESGFCVSSIQVITVHWNMQKIIEADSFIQHQINGTERSQRNRFSCRGMLDFDEDFY